MSLSRCRVYLRQREREGEACIFIAGLRFFPPVSSLLFTVLSPFRSFRTVWLGLGEICINLWPNHNISWLFRTCCSPPPPLPPPPPALHLRTLCILNGTFELSPDNGIIIFTLATAQWDNALDNGTKAERSGTEHLS